MTEHQIYSDEGVLFVALAGATLIWIVAQLLARGRPGLDLRWPLLSALVLRVTVAAALNLTSIGSSVRGSDEAGYLYFTHHVGQDGGWNHLLTKQFFEFVAAAQVKLFGAPDLAIRISQATLTVLGLGLIAAAVYELAGCRPARLAAWIFVFEPANVFFSTVVGKEPMMFLAEGLVIYGGSVVWRRARLLPVALMTLGCLLALGTRQYAGWFLIASSAAILLHAGLRNASGYAARSIVLVAIVAGLAVVSTPAVINGTSKQELAGLQESQNANSSDNSNLKLAPIDFSSRSSVLLHLPQRIFDVTFRPFPWQIGDLSQRLGVVETLVVLTIVALFAKMLATRRTDLFRRAGPLAYTAGLMLVAYSLSAGNAGTAFRYRTHVVVMMIAIMAILREPELSAVRARIPAARRRLTALDAG